MPMTAWCVVQRVAVSGRCGCNSVAGCEECAGGCVSSAGVLRAKIISIAGYFAFLEQRYAGKISRVFGAAIESPVDPFNRPRHRSDFGSRVPPPRTAITQFFARWHDSLPDARKEAVACRDYVMGKIAYLSGSARPSCTGCVRHPPN